MLYHVGHGDVIPKPNVQELQGDRVRFVDGTEAEIDMIIYATGFKISFPFIDQQTLNWQNTGPDLFMHMAHREYDNLFVIGLLQPNSGIFWMMDLQSQLMARFLKATTENTKLADAFRRTKSSANPDMRGGNQHIDSLRHFLECGSLYLSQADREAD